VLVQSLPDGAAEVLAVERGVYYRYLVRENGSAVIVESRPRNWRWPLENVVGWAFVVFAFGIPILFAVLDREHALSADPWAAISVFVGLILLLATWVVRPSPHHLMHPGQRWADWDQVGWPED
jgi:hypothetical protein